MSKLFDVLLAFLSLLTGSLLGRIRGGHVSGIVDARIKAKGLLVAGIGATLVLNVLTPSIPMFWLVVAMLSFLGFAAANLTLTGMIVLTIGMVLNLFPVLANGAVPVSELALQSVDIVDATGAAIIDGPRESTATATRLAFLGDVIPVPIVNRVVSLGDLIILVALGDLVMNLLLRSRDRDPDDLGVTYAAPTNDSVIDLTDDEDVEGPRHAAPGGRVRSHSSRHRRPAHAKPESDDIDLRPPPLPSENAAPTSVADTDMSFGAELSGENTSATADTQVSIESSRLASPDAAPAPQAEDVIDLTDRRPIIDLTISPSDEQLAEFLRRREAADVRATTLAPPSPGHRRNRIRSRRRHHRELAQTDS